MTTNKNSIGVRVSPKMQSAKRTAGLRLIVTATTGIKKVSLGFFSACFCSCPVFAVNFGQENVSQDARYITDWVVDSKDNHNLPFAIVDKKQAKVFVFYADGQLRGAAPALLGLALGDDAVPGIGERKLSTIRSDERTTPAGRFVAELGRNAHDDEVLWVDYVSAVSMHRVIRTKSRLHSLSTPTPLDNRMTFGCINVPEEFYNTVVSPAFTGTKGIVYVLPEIRTLQKVFGSYEVKVKP